ncbi:endolytic transglycosylase MltG [Desulfovibrio sp. OttesenSCG-928-F20]|nr:endolytic transglycosylase MltG [Desulfovibrio sp. OttesenSCG-928-M16]MDL2290646.1 endolytic transglycosylase MltG [Desulfovibrio sp. OttesenSCG-928-F20]
MRRFILLLFWVLLIGAGLAAFEAQRFLSSPASEQPQEFLFTVEQGATFDRVAWDLKKAGAITDVNRFRILAQWQDALGRIRAGEYLISTGWTPGQVLEQLTRGRSVLYRLSLREGLTWWETAKAIEEQGFATYEDFKAVIHDPNFLREHYIPFANAEGFLFPETYLLKKPRAPLDREQAREVAAIMVTMFWKKSEHLWKALPLKGETQALFQTQTGAMASPPEARANATLSANTTSIGLGNATTSNGNTTCALPRSVPASPAEIDPQALKHLVILASLVEKETGVPAERALVAGVYANRLRLGMLLQCDPTIIYGIGETFSGAIRRSQIDNPDNIYNTYQHPGLPPGPICTAGLDALKAAANPARHDFLYFVATGQGGSHTFSKSLNEHNRAVQIYRQRIRGQ